MKMQHLVNTMRATVLFVIVTVLIFSLVEGVSSVTIVGYEIMGRRSGGWRSRVHVQYDSLLGWVNIPERSFPDMYGPGMDLTINKQSSRNEDNIDPKVAKGRVRVLCVGDSFTLGIGVASRHTWCDLLEALDDRLETYNFGEAGYGIGQAFLKYKRYSSDMQYDVIVFAFIKNDFQRMQVDRLFLYPKPRMRLVDGHLATENVPVPTLSGPQRWLARNASALQQLRSVTLADIITSRIFGELPTEAGETDRGRALAMAILQAVAEEATGKGARVLFVYLPDGARATTRAEEMWSSYLGAELRSRQLPWLDLVTQANYIPFAQRDAMYDPEWFHYTEAGNTYVAEHVHDALQTILSHAGNGSPADVP